MRSDTTTKSTTPLESDSLLVALALLAIALEALWLALRPLLAHGIALVLTAARWRLPAPAPQPQPLNTTPRARRTRRPVPAAA